MTRKAIRCGTPLLTEDEIKAEFVRMVNRLYADREFYITELTAIKDRLGDTTASEKERRILDEQLGIDAKAVNDLIARNARVARTRRSTTSDTTRWSTAMKKQSISAMPSWSRSTRS